jgi:hypothetical protein
MAFLAGVLMEHGYTGDANDPYGVLLWAGNYAHSVSVRRRADPAAVAARADGTAKTARRNLFKR